MRSKFLGMFVVAAMGLSSYTASARVVSISGTHSQSEIQNTCAANNGVFLPPDSKGSYGCAKVGLVTCNRKGVCTGTVPN
jgi:hypothetical protein